MMKKLDISYYPENWRQFFYRRVRDNRIGTMNTVDHIGKNSISIITLVVFVGNQKALYIFRKKIWSKKHES